MIKLLLLILLGVLIFALGFQAIPSGSSTRPGDAIEGANKAVEQSRDLQNKINQKAGSQLN